MLSYAFHILNEQGYKSIALEEFDNTADLCASILIKGITMQIKRGLMREYIPITETCNTIKGKIELNESVKRQSLINNKIVCSYDEFSSDAFMNQILKSTMILLLQADIKNENKKQLRKILVYFNDVKEIDIVNINWNLQYNRNNQTYRMLMSICYMVVKGLLQTQSDGSVKLMDFMDEERMSHLYEKFILEYYKKEYPMIKTSASQIPWQLDDEENTFLPIMQSDITLERGDKILIIDAKYYANILHERFKKQTVSSGNVYQIFTYVKNKQIEVGNGREVSGMLLYAKTDEDNIPDVKYRMSGNEMFVKTLDLNQEFGDIKVQLNNIVEDYFMI